MSGGGVSGLASRSRVNLGFAGGVNLGLAASADDVAVLLNNDALATPGRLAGLLDAPGRGDGAGIAGPRSNWVSDDDDEVNAIRYAAKWDPPMHGDPAASCPPGASTPRPTGSPLPG